jgi:(1->4)-alpha-D-glucan 1-alpha-D-glucosylmutase
MASEVNELGHRLDLISEGDRRWRDFTRNNLTLAIREVIAAFPVYRTYIPPQGPVSERDRRYIHIAIEKAKSKAPALTPAVFEFLKKILLLDFDEVMDEETEKQYRDFVLRFQQLTGPVMAKGLEDTSFYIYNRLTSLNEVGGDPNIFGISPEEFHRKNTERGRRWPYSMVCTSTHDTKRSEDVRTRIHVLSEMPVEWKSHIEKWSVLNQQHKTLFQETLVPRKNLEYFIYQTLIGVWPDYFSPEMDIHVFRERMWEYFQKASREAMLYTSWSNPNVPYEEAVKKFIYGILSLDNENLFLQVFMPCQQKIAAFGLWNAISALVLKAGSPGVIDTYQGTEFWNYTLVDPDNRRPVNFKQRYDSLLTLKRISEESFDDFFEELTESRWDGRLKMFVLWKSLELRKQRPELFLDADYIGLKVDGEKKANAVAFMRKKNGKSAVVAAGRFFSQILNREEDLPVGEKVWPATFIILPDAVAEGAVFKDFITGREIKAAVKDGQKVLPLSDVFFHLSATILLSV